jgi:hypothetical protein
MSKFKENIKWFFKEIGMMYTNKHSFFSKKRIESGLAFIIAQWGMITYFLDHHLKMDMGSMLMWAAAEFTIAGWTISQIQKEKKFIEDNQNSSYISTEENNEEIPPDNQEEIN